MCGGEREVEVEVMLKMVKFVRFGRRSAGDAENGHAAELIGLH